MKKYKNNLDEMQEQKLLKIEHNGMWFAFVALLLAILIQFCMGADVSQLAGEWIVFMALCLYIAIGCMKNGIWDRRLKPNFKTNLVLSLITSVVFGAVFAVFQYKTSIYLKDEIVALLVLTLCMIIFIFVACFAALQITAYIYKKRVKNLEESCESKDI